MSNIVVSYPQQQNITRATISALINKSLESIEPDITSWNGYVEMRNTEDGQYMLIAKCDNEEIRSKMQWMLNIELNRMKAD